jgi:hypothetical protein
MIERGNIRQFRPLSRKVLTANEAAFLYGLSPGTLANWRHMRVGPKFYKMGGKVAYFPEDLENWARREPVLTKDSVEL